MVPVMFSLNMCWGNNKSFMFLQFNIKLIEASDILYFITSSTKVFFFFLVLVTKKILFFFLSHFPVAENDPMDSLQNSL